MRVLHVQKVSGIGGSERHLLVLLPALAAAGVEVRICALTAGRANEFTDRLRALNVSHRAIPAGPDANPLLIRSLLREMRDFRADLLHTHLIHADIHGQLAARLGKLPSVSSVHGTPSFYRREPYRSARRIAGRTARLTIAISEHVRRFIEDLRLSRPGSVRVVPYGIDASTWLLSDSARASARRHFGLEPAEVAVGIASRLISGKGHAFLLEGYERAAQRAPELRLLVAGDGPLRPELERRAAALAAPVRFFGFATDMTSFMNACDVIVFPTQPELSEGFGLAALEAMAAGRPVLATAVGSLPELIAPGETGRLIEPSRVDELTAALVDLAGSSALRTRLGSRGHERACRHFSLEAMVERTRAVYTEAAEA